MRFLVCLLAFAAAALVHAETPEETVAKAFATLAPGIKVDSVQQSAIPSFYEVIAGGQFVYVSHDGRFIFDGKAFDTKTRLDLTETSRAHMRQAALAKVGPDQRIVFAPAAKPKHTVTVFTDVDCPFCKRFHSQIAQYNEQGIAVEYLFYPLSIHPGADKKAEAVWCSKDRKAAYSAAMAGQDFGNATCPNPIASLEKLGRDLGINSTPTVLAEDGTQVTPQLALFPSQLAAELDRLAQVNAARE